MHKIWNPTEKFCYNLKHSKYRKKGIKCLTNECIHLSVCMTLQSISYAAIHITVNNNNCYNCDVCYKNNNDYDDVKCWNAFLEAFSGK